jgi:hypothetical protein
VSFLLTSIIAGSSPRVSDEDAGPLTQSSVDELVAVVLDRALTVKDYLPDGGFLPTDGPLLTRAEAAAPWLPGALKALDGNFWGSAIVINAIQTSRIAFGTEVWHHRGTAWVIADEAPREGHVFHFGGNAPAAIDAPRVNTGQSI